MEALKVELRKDDDGIRGGAIEAAMFLEGMLLCCYAVNRVTR